MAEFHLLRIHLWMRCICIILEWKRNMNEIKEYCVIDYNLHLRISYKETNYINTFVFFL